MLAKNVLYLDYSYKVMREARVHKPREFPKGVPVSLFIQYLCYWLPCCTIEEKPFNDEGQEAHFTSAFFRQSEMICRMIPKLIHW